MRIKYYLTSFLVCCERQETEAHFDDIIREVMPSLKNDSTPNNQTILNVLGDIGEKWLEVEERRTKSIDDVAAEYRFYVSLLELQKHGKVGTVAWGLWREKGIMSPLTINDTDFLEQLQKLPFTAKQEFLDFINEKIRDEEHPKTVPEFDWGKDLIVSYVDDDEHLADFKKYM